MGKIKVGIMGVGNCASSLVQGLEYYKDAKGTDFIPGLMHTELGGHKIGEAEVVAAFDIDERKVGKDVSEAVFAPPNCTTKFSGVPKKGVEVKMAPVMDGFNPELMEKYPENRRFVVSKETPVDVAKELQEKGVEVLVNYVPVGSEKAAKFYAEEALKAGCAFINCMPVFIASDNKWRKRFEEKRIPVLGDDIKSQVGATIVHRTLARLFADRGTKLNHTYQLNVGGNTDFLNMLDIERLKSKKKSKTESVQSQLPEKMEDEDIHIGPSDYVPWLKDNKLCFIRMEAKNFGGVPFNIELRLSVEDSPNSAGVVIDAIRCAKLALERRQGGAIIGPSSYFFKHPPEQFPDSRARELVEEFIKGK